MTIFKTNVCHFTHTNVDYVNDWRKRWVLSNFLKLFKVVAVTTDASRLFQILATAPGSTAEFGEQTVSCSMRTSSDTDRARRLHGVYQQTDSLGAIQWTHRRASDIYMPSRKRFSPLCSKWSWRNSWVTSSRLVAPKISRALAFMTAYIAVFGTLEDQLSLFYNIAASQYTTCVSVLELKVALNYRN